jgi:hypothetical protein
MPGASEGIEVHRKTSSLSYPRTPAPGHTTLVRMAAGDRVALLGYIGNESIYGGTFIFDGTALIEPPRPKPVEPTVVDRRPLF